MQTDNWQESLVEELAFRYELSAIGKTAVYEAIRRTLEKAVEQAEHYSQFAYYPKRIAAALRQLMEPGK